eukprot:742263-Rhodomonas_salina.2
MSGTDLRYLPTGWPVLTYATSLRDGRYRPMLPPYAMSVSGTGLRAPCAMCGTERVYAPSSGAASEAGDASKAGSVSGSQVVGPYAAPTRSPVLTYGICAYAGPPGTAGFPYGRRGDRPHWWWARLPGQVLPYAAATRSPVLTSAMLLQPLVAGPKRRVFGVQRLGSQRTVATPRSTIPPYAMSGTDWGGPCARPTRSPERAVGAQREARRGGAKVSWPISLRAARY